MSAPAMAQDLNEVLNEIGVGSYQFMLLCLTGGVMLTDGAEILVASSLLSALQEAWSLTPLMRGAMMSTVFLGVMFGCILGGTVGDLYGRRKAVLMSYVALVVFGGVGAMAWGPLSMLVCRFLFGVSFGSGIAPGISMIVESSPTHWRSHIMNFGSLWYCAGEVYTSILLIIFMPDLLDNTDKQWRYVTLLSVAPGLFFFLLSWVFLQESPHFLLAQGKHAEAVKVVQYIAHVNHKADKIQGLNYQNPEITLKLPTAGERTALMDSAAAPRRQTSSSSQSLLVESKPGMIAHLKESIEVLSSGEYRGIVIGGAYLCFLSNFLFYGLTYALPQVFRHLHKHLEPAYQVLFVSICDVPGVLVVFFFLYAKNISHRSSLMILAMCASVLCLTLTSIQNGPRGLYVGLPSAYLIKYTSMSFFSLSYIYLSEVFPAKIRTSGIAFCIAAGRIGSMMAPLMVESLHVKKFQVYDNKLPDAPFLVLTSGLCLLAPVFIKTFLHFELKNKPLRDIDVRSKDVPGPSDAERPAAAG